MYTIMTFGWSSFKDTRSKSCQPIYPKMIENSETDMWQFFLASHPTYLVKISCPCLVILMPKRSLFLDKPSSIINDLGLLSISNRKLNLKMPKKELVWDSLIDSYTGQIVLLLTRFVFIAVTQLT